MYISSLCGFGPHAMLLDFSSGDTPSGVCQPDATIVTPWLVCDYVHEQQRVDLSWQHPPHAFLEFVKDGLLRSTGQTPGHFRAMPYVPALPDGQAHVKVHLQPDTRYYLLLAEDDATRLDAAEAAARMRWRRVQAECVPAVSGRTLRLVARRVVINTDTGASPN